jgi:hypothetical protein
MKNLIIKELINISQELDDKGFYKQSDTIDNLVRFAQYAGPQNLNLPMDTRVIPFGEMESEFEDVARKRRQYYPRLQPKEREQDDAADVEDVYGPQGETEEDKEQYKVNNKSNNIFDINQGTQNEGGSIFSVNGPSIGGIAQRIYDPKGAGYMGIDHFTWDNRDENKKGYPTYSPN